jgi:branched-chain amino acid transport system ATP-binding protein
MNLLEISHLKKNFGGVDAVDDLSFSVEEFETLGIIGPNGAGKTTVFNLISGLYQPDGGRMFFFNRDINRLAPFQMARLGLSRTFQNLRLFNSLTVSENIKAPFLSHQGYGLWPAVFRTRGFRQREQAAEKKIEELLAFFQLTGKGNYPANSLSYGEQRKLELARAVSGEPRLLLIDEPGAGMNPREIQDLVGIVRQIKTHFRLTILLIEHQMGLVMNVSDRVVVMDYGQKIAEGPPLEIKKNKKVIEAYLGDQFVC